MTYLSQQLAFWPGSSSRFDPSKLLCFGACLVQNLTGVVVYVDPHVQAAIAVSQVSCVVQSFAVFPKWSARRCKSVDWIQSYDAILAPRCLCLHYSPHGIVPPLFGRRHRMRAGHLEREQQNARITRPTLSGERDPEKFFRQTLSEISPGSGHVHCTTSGKEDHSQPCFRIFKIYRPEGIGEGGTSTRMDVRSCLSLALPVATSTSLPCVVVTRTS